MSNPLEEMRRLAGIASIYPDRVHQREEPVVQPPAVETAAPSWAKRRALTEQMLREVRSLAG